MIVETRLDAKNSPSNQPEDTHPLENVRIMVLLGGSELFGHERATIEVFRSLSEKGAHVRFIISSRLGKENIAPYLEQFELDWVALPFGYHWYYLKCFGVNLWSLIKTNLGLWEEIRTWQPTHFYTGNWLCMTYASACLLSTSVPLVYRAGDKLHASTILHRFFNHLMFRKVSRVVCNCQFLATQFQTHFPRLPLRIIYNYPPTRPTSTHQTQIPSTPLDATVLLYTGQISEHKGVPILIESAIQLLQSNYNISLWIAGDATYNLDLMEQLKLRVELSGYAHHIHFLGYVEDMEIFWKQADIHICPSIWDEPSPNVIFEAKKAGVPSVVFPSGGIPELVTHQVNGHICSELTSSNLSHGIRTLLESPKRREHYAEAAYTSFKDYYDHDRFVQQWTDVFTKT